MNYTVIWKSSAEQELARLWTQASDRTAVTSAANAIDIALQRDPSVKGESRSGATRIMISAPLAVHFRVSETRLPGLRAGSLAFASPAISLFKVHPVLG